jgi:hypothetical protein
VKFHRGNLRFEALLEAPVWLLVAVMVGVTALVVISAAGVF